jgi:hypothetical protein
VCSPGSKKTSLSHFWGQIGRMDQTSKKPWTEKHWKFYLPSQEDENDTMWGIMESIIEWNMRLSVTQKGYLGGADIRARAGDSIALLLGWSVPVILHPRTGGGWHVIGDAIINGLMHGEAFESVEVEELGFITLH